MESKESKETFDDQGRRIKDGVAYDRATHIIHATGEGRKIIDAWKKRVGEEEAERVSRETAEWGEAVHEITAWDDRGKWEKVEKMLKENEALLPSLLAWREWVGLVIKKWVMIEEVIYNRQLRIAGRIDRVGYIVGDTHPSIVDIKTGALWDTTGVQVWGAYRELYNGSMGKKRKPVMKGIGVQVSRKEPGVLRVKDYTKDKYVEMWEDAKRDYWNATGRR